MFIAAEFNGTHCGKALGDIHAMNNLGWFNPWRVVNTRDDREEEGAK